MKNQKYQYLKNNKFQKNSKYKEKLKKQSKIKRLNMLNNKMMKMINKKQNQKFKN